MGSDFSAETANFDAAPTRQVDHVTAAARLAGLIQLAVKRQNQIDAALEHALVEALPRGLSVAAEVVGVLGPRLDGEAQRARDFAGKRVGAGAVAVEDDAVGRERGQLAADGVRVGPL